MNSPCRGVTEANAFGTSSVTLVLWTVTFTVGVIGLYVPWQRSAPRVSSRPTSQAEILNITLAEDRVSHDPAPVATPVPTGAQTPVPNSAATPPALVHPSPELSSARLEAVAEVPTLPEFPTPQPPAASTATPPASTASAVSPVVSTVDAKLDAVGPQNPASSGNSHEATTPVQTLRYGEGEGIQPAPNYPAASRREGQQGTVVVRFSVGTDGRVISAEAVRPSPWPLLTESALEVIRHRWRFRAGAARIYEVSIRFQLSR